MREEMLRKTGTLEAAKRGTFGFFELAPGHLVSGRKSAFVLHVFQNGDLLVRFIGNKRFRAIVPADDFTPSREAFFCEGSGWEPEWEAGTCRCTNLWEVNSGPENCYTDEEAKDAA